MTFRPPFSTLGALALACALTACNATVVGSATPATGTTAGSQAAATTPAAGADQPGPGGPMGGMPGGPGGMGGPGGGGVAGYFAQLDLSDDQITRLDAVTEQYQPVMGQPPAAQPPTVDTAALLTAATLDEAALRAAIATAAQRPDAQVDELAMLQAYRAILDDAQRSDLATLLRAAPLQAGGPGGAPPDGGPGMMVPGTEGLELTEAQQAKLDAFQAALGTNAQGGPGGRLNLIAVADFFESGDAAALDADATADYPVDALVDLAKALSATQRATFFAAGAPGLPGARPQPGAFPG